jgi:solute carrier family 35 (GDP-fucose transporter), member C1
MITFNNLSLKHVPISFYMIAKSLATFFNLVLVYVYFGEKTSIRAISCCVIITIGFCLGINQEKISNSKYLIYFYLI